MNGLASRLRGIISALNSRRYLVYLGGGIADVTDLADPGQYGRYIVLRSSFVLAQVFTARLGRSRAGIIGRECPLQISELADLLAQILGTGHNILEGVEGISHAQTGGRPRHELHESLLTRPPSSIGVAARLLLNNRDKQLDIEGKLLGRLLNNAAVPGHDLGCRPATRDIDRAGPAVHAARRLADRYLAAANLFDIGAQGFRLFQEFLKVP